MFSLNFKELNVIITKKFKYHKSYYSLNSQPYLENESLNMNLSADKMINDLSHKEMMDYIFCCIRKLPKKEKFQNNKILFRRKKLNPDSKGRSCFHNSSTFINSARIKKA